MIALSELSDSDADQSRLRAFYESIYVEQFPDRNERESLENMQRYLGLKAQGWYGANNYHIVLATDAGVPVGGSISDFLAEAEAGVIEFLAVTPGAQRGGVGRALLDETERLLALDAERGIQAPIACIVAEMNDPRRPAGVPDNMDPAARTLIWHRWGYRGLDFPYVQPALSEEQGSVENLILLAKPFRPEWQRALPARGVERIVHEYLRWAMRIEAPAQCVEYRGMAAHLGSHPEVNALSLAEYVGRDAERPLVVREVRSAESADFSAVMALYRAAFDGGPHCIDEREFRRALGAERAEAAYHLWALGRSEASAPEGFASFFASERAGFGGYVAFSGELRRSGRFPLLVARIEEQMLRDYPGARGWYAEAALDRDLAPLLRAGFRELALEYVQPPLRAGLARVPARLLYRPFGRSYAAPRLGPDELLEDVEGILRAVYAVADSRADATYLRLVSSLDASGGRVRVR